MDAFEILVVILSVTLATFLILGIILMVYAIKVVKTIKRLSAKAESVVDSAANITKVITPSVIGKQVFDAVQKAVKNHKKGG